MKKQILLFLLIMLIIPSLKAQYNPNPDGWNFYNYLMTTDDDELWDIFSKAFLGVAQEKSQASSDDLTFYDLVISNYAGHASCFGMSLLSLICFHEGGHLAVCGPVYQYEGGLTEHNGPDLDVVRESISIMHLRQLSQPMISKLIDLFNDYNWNDPEYAYNQIKTSIASHDYPLLSFMPSSIAAIEALGEGAEAHTIVPYATSETATHYRIYVYDPNFPYSTSTDFYTGTTQRNYIDVKKSGWTHDWKYPPDYDPSDPNSYGWNGSTSGPWTFLATNVSDAKYKHNHPLNVGYLTGQLGTLIFSSGGTAEQITDEQGKRFYKKSGTDLELEKDPAKKTDNIIRWPFFHGEGNTEELYFIKDVNGKDYTLDIASESKGYQCDFLLKGKSVTLNVGKSSSGKDNLKLQTIGTADQLVELSSERELKNVVLEMTVRLPDGRTERKFIISELNVKSKSPVVIKIADMNSSLRVESPQNEIEYMLELKQIHKGSEVKLAPQKIVVPRGQMKTIKPLDWNSLEVDELQIKERELQRK
ncbi:MAG: hypothetical protein JW996_05930 [Candidatus Cloacimonetes bacterium]|nr:hypothetical protein [Candidatus Cloacimonadota bacterium]